MFTINTTKSPSSAPQQAGIIAAGGDLSETMTVTTMTTTSREEDEGDYNLSSSSLSSSAASSFDDASTIDEAPTHAAAIVEPHTGYKKVLVTGGAGFIGSHVARFLLERGDDVVIVDEM